MKIDKMAGVSGGHTITRGHINDFSNCAKIRMGSQKYSCQNVGSQKGLFGVTKGTRDFNLYQIFIYYLFNSFTFRFVNFDDSEYVSF